MKKAFPIVFVLMFLLGSIGCSSKGKIPSVSEVSQMKYGEVNEALLSKNIQEIRDAWGEPATSDGNEDVWKLDESMLLMITYNDYELLKDTNLSAVHR